MDKTTIGLLSGAGVLTGTGAAGVAALNKKNQSGTLTAAEAAAGLTLVGAGIYGFTQMEQSETTPTLTPAGDQVNRQAPKPNPTIMQQEHLAEEPPTLETQAAKETAEEIQAAKTDGADAPQDGAQTVPERSTSEAAGAARTTADETDTAKSDGADVSQGGAEPLPEQPPTEAAGAAQATSDKKPFRQSLIELSQHTIAHSEALIETAKVEIRKHSSKIHELMNGASEESLSSDVRAQVDGHKKALREANIVLGREKQNVHEAKLEIAKATRAEESGNHPVAPECTINEHKDPDAWHDVAEDIKLKR